MCKVETDRIKILLQSVIESIERFTQLLLIIITTTIGDNAKIVREDNTHEKQ